MPVVGPTEPLTPDSPNEGWPKEKPYDPGWHGWEPPPYMRGPTIGREYQPGGNYDPKKEERLPPLGPIDRPLRTNVNYPPRHNPPTKINYKCEPIEMVNIGMWESWLGEEDSNVSSPRGQVSLGGDGPGGYQGGGGSSGDAGKVGKSRGSHGVMDGGGVESAPGAGGGQTHPRVFGGPAGRQGKAGGPSGPAYERPHGRSGAPGDYSRVHGAAGTQSGPVGQRGGHTDASGVQGDAGSPSGPVPNRVGRGGSAQQAVANEWRRAGMSEAGIAGVMANIQDESGFRAGSLEKNPTGAARRLGGGHGLYQFTGPEWTKYNNWLNKNHPGARWNDPALQSRFVAENIKRGSGVPKSLWGTMAAGPKEKAAQAFVSQYERPRADLRRHREAKYGRGVPSVSAYTGHGGEFGGGGATGNYNPVNAPPSTGKTLNAVASSPYGYRTHGDINMGGHHYPWVSGGAGKGALPYGDWKINRPSIMPSYPGKGESYQLTGGNAPGRGGFFIHEGATGPGSASLGCVHINPRQMGQFRRDMAAGGYSTLHMGQTPDGKEKVQTLADK